MTHMATFAAKLTKLLEAKDWPQQRLRDVLSGPASTGLVNNWASGKGPLPRLDQAFEIAKALDVDLNWLADDSADMPPPPMGTGVAELTEKDIEVLRIAKLLGHERALNRMLGIPSVGDFGPLP